MFDALRRLIRAGDAFRVGTSELFDATLPDVGDVRAKASAFWTLMVCSTIIAAAGVRIDSTAVVIGAMVITPLGTPIYGLAAALVANRDPRAVLVRLGLGCLLAVGVGIVVEWITIERMVSEANPQILSRTNPSLVDLLIAVATGVAGSLALIRRDVSPAFTGVAIAISLVPPLTVVGITIGSGDFHLAFGALLLFLTNALAIVLTSLAVFAAAGVGADERPGGEHRPMRSRVTLLASSVVIIFLLAAGTGRAVQLLQVESDVRSAAEDWARVEPDWELNSVQRSGEDVVVEFIGSGDAPDLALTAAGRRLTRINDGKQSLLIRFDQGTRIE